MGKTPIANKKGAGAKKAAPLATKKKMIAGTKTKATGSATKTKTVAGSSLGAGAKRKAPGSSRPMGTDK